MLGVHTNLTHRVRTYVLVLTNLHCKLVPSASNLNGKKKTFDPGTQLLPFVLAVTENARQ